MLIKPIIKLYKLTQPLRSQIYITLGINPHACKHSPTCSKYTHDAIARYGTIRGLYLGLVRFINCR